MRSIHKNAPLSELKTQNSIISYEQINTVSDDDLVPIIEGYSSISNKNFYEVCKPEFLMELLDSYDTSPLNTNWKVHLSCAQESLPKLWDLVVPILQQNDCPAFKCIKLASLSQSQRNALFGKRSIDALQFTFYIYPGEEIKYVALLEQIEELLLENQIVRTTELNDYLFKSDKRIGVYTSVRHSSGPDGKYLSAPEASKLRELNPGLSIYNCAGVEDPFNVMTSLKKLQAELEKPKLQVARSSMWKIALQIMEEQKKNTAYTLDTYPK